MTTPESRSFLTRTALAAIASLLCSNLLVAQDQLVLQALKKIEAVETALGSLENGDAREATRLLAELKWANKRLNAAYKKDTTHWKSAAERLAKADSAIRAKAAATPGGEPAEKMPDGKQPVEKQPAGKQPSGKQPGGAPNDAGKGPVVGAEFEKLQQLNKEVGNGFNNLKLLNKTFMGDGYRVASTTKELAKLKARLADFPADDANVKIVAANLGQFEALFETWKAEYKADSEAAIGLEQKLDAIAAKYASQSVPGPLYWPFELEKLTQWASVTKKLQDDIPADLAVIDAAANNSIVGKKAKNLQHWVGRTIDKRLQEQAGQVQYQCNNAVTDALRTAKTLREIKPDDEHAIINRVLHEGALERSMASLQKGLEAVDQAAALDTALAVKDAPDRKAQRQEIEATVTVLRDLAKVALAQVRMPKPVTVDAKKMEALTKIAQETLAKKKYGVNEIQKLVVTSDMQRKEKKEGTIQGTTTGATITTYHYVWDEFRVVTAEKIGADLWVFHNVLKFYHSSDSVTPQDVWILSRRFQSTQILPANLDMADPAK